MGRGIYRNLTTQPSKPPNKHLARSQPSWMNTCLEWRRLTHMSRVNMKWKQLKEMITWGPTRSCSWMWSHIRRLANYEPKCGGSTPTRWRQMGEQDKWRFKHECAYMTGTQCKQQTVRTSHVPQGRPLLNISGAGQPKNVTEVVSLPESEPVDTCTSLVLLK